MNYELYFQFLDREKELYKIITDNKQKNNCLNLIQNDILPSLSIIYDLADKTNKFTLTYLNDKIYYYKYLINKMKF
jgi:hypothetical protein